MPSQKKLILGGAQIGQEYGLVKSTSFSVDTEVQQLLDSAAEAGFTAIDTGRTYGRSEEFIGASRWSGEIHTKLDEHTSPSSSLEASLEALGLDRVDLIYLCHDAARVRDVSAQYWGPELERLEAGALEIGVAVYADQLFFPLLDFSKIQVIQVPFNILSSRATRVRLRQLREAGKTVIARSIFAQGFLLDPLARESNAQISNSIGEFHEVCRALGLGPAELAFRWALSHPDIDGVIVGIGALQEVNPASRWITEGQLREEEFAIVEDSLEASRIDIDLRKL